MKNRIINALIVMLLFVACKKETSKKEQDNIKEEEKTTEVALKNEVKDLKYNYKTANGESFEVTFLTDSVKRVKITMPSQEETLILNQTTAWAKGAEYANENYKLISKDKDITFIKEKDTLQLKLVE